jgi:hypothetical protein
MGVDWGDFVLSVANRVDLDRKRQISKCLGNFGRREDYDYMPLVMHQGRVGRQRLLAWERCKVIVLNKIATEEGKYLSTDQEKLLDEYRSALALKMYAGIKGLLSDVNWLRETFGIRVAHDTKAIIYPRRHGKTFVQTIASAITLLSQRNGNVCAYNPLTGQAKAWLVECRKWLNYMKDDPEFGWTEISSSEGRYLRIRQKKAGAIVSIHVYGNATNKRNAQSLRGSGNNVMLVNIDEGLFFHVEAFKVILPAAANGAVLILTSSKPSEKNDAVDILKATYHDNGQLAWHILDWRPLCESCSDKEKHTGREVVCKHGAKPPDHFRSYTDQERTMALMTPLNAYGSEMENISAANPARPAFDATAIDHCIGVESYTVPLLERESHFFIAVDPGSTKGRSNTAITSFILSRRLPGLMDVPSDFSLFDGHLTVRIFPIFVAFVIIFFLFLLLLPSLSLWAIAFYND